MKPDEQMLLIEMAKGLERLLALEARDAHQMGASCYMQAANIREAVAVLNVPLLPTSGFVRFNTREYPAIIEIKDYEVVVHLPEGADCTNAYGMLHIKTDLEMDK